MLWDRQHLYALFISFDPEIQAKLEDRDAEVWTEDCVSLFLSSGQAMGAQGKSGVYFKFQVTPLNTLHDAKVVHWTEKVTDEELKSAAIWNGDGIETAVHVITPDKEKQARKVWIVEMKIPFLALGMAPSKGDQWKINVGRIDQSNGVAQTLTWSHLSRWFHEPDNFGVLEFEK